MWLFYSWNVYLNKRSECFWLDFISERHKSICTEDDGLRLENVAIVGLNLKVNQDK